MIGTAHRLMTRNAPRPSQSTTGDERRPHFVYGRAGRPCLRCGARVRTAEAGDAATGAGCVLVPDLPAEPAPWEAV